MPQWFDSYMFEDNEFKYVVVGLNATMVRFILTTQEQLDSLPGKCLNATMVRFI